MQKFRAFLIKPYLYLIIILIGISLKFYQLDYKLFWFDEVCTIQHTSGISDKEYPCLIPEGEIKDIGFYKDQYRLNKQDFSLGSQLQNLATSTQLNPLYYPLLMVWYRIAGDTPVDFRLFSVMVFIMSLPFLFLLSKKLFNSQLAGWITVSLYAISPYIHLFAQEARYYIFWSFALIGMHYLFLKVVDQNKTKWWIVYSFITALALYASPISIIIIFGHAVFILLTQKRLIKTYCLSMFIVSLVYLPWAISLYFKLNEITSALSWHSKNPDDFHLLSPLFGEFLYLISVFSNKLDYLTVLKQSPFLFTSESVLAIIFNAIILAIICVSVFHLLKKTSKDILYFICLIIIPGLVFFYIHDILRNGMTSWWWRYLIFISTGMFLLVTNVLYKKVEKGSIPYFVCFLAMVFVGISSIMTISKAKFWHIGGDGMHTYVDIADVLSKAENPLIITDFSKDTEMVKFVVVMEECSSDSIDVLKTSYVSNNLMDVVEQNNYSDIYVLYASDELLTHLKLQFKNNMILLKFENVASMWKIQATPAIDYRLEE